MNGKTILALFLLFLTGCAAKVNLKKPHLGIPINCIDKVLGGDGESYCESTENPDIVICKNVAVHIVCTQVVKPPKK